MTERIEGKICRAKLVPEALTSCLECLPAIWGNVPPDPRRRTPFEEQYIASTALRIEALRAARQAIGSSAPPEVDVFSEVRASLDEAIAFLEKIVAVLNANPTRLDVGLFLEALRYRFGLKPVELALILVHHPRVLHYMMGSLDESALKPNLSDVSGWIRKRIHRATKRIPGRRKPQMGGKGGAGEGDGNRSG